MELLPSAYAINPPDIGWNYSAKYTKDSVASLSDELFQGYPSGLLTFASATCIVFILVGVPGNLITIIALARCKKVRNATAVFIINLSLSDLLFCCFNLPLAASTFWYRAWIHGELLCRFFPLLRYGLLAVSLFTILAITINRYVMIGHPRIYPRVYRHKYLGVMVAATWLGAFCALIPTWRGAWGQFGLDQTIGSCSILRDENQRSPKEFLFMVAFVVPCISIVVCYARIFYIVRKTAMRTHDPNTLTSSSIHIHQPAKNQPNRGTTKHNSSDGAELQLLKANNSDHIDPHENTSENSNSNNTNNNDRNHRSQQNEIDGISERSSNASYTQTHQGLCGPKILLKFIDSSVDSDLPPSLSGLRTPSNNKDPKLLSESDRNLSSISISKTVEFKDNNDDDENDGANRKNSDFIGNRISDDKQQRRKSSIIKNHTLSAHEVDSAVEESTSSSENNQIYHIKSTNNNCNQLLSVQIEPSSSSGIDIPLDNDSPPRRLKTSFTTSIRRVRRSKDNKGNSIRKQSTMNTSGASILYPGRMTTKDRRLLKMILVIFVSFLICYLPITTTKIIRSVHEIPVLNIMGYLLIYLTTCINPIIYVVMSSEYRQAYVNLLMCRTSVVSRPPKTSSKDPGRKNSNKT